ncbi:MAG: hypothetical protein PHE24_03475 [Patescibacteria group bacterium]|nr:hypothetical protein [Patescibacteria group bacterium]
MRQCTFGSDTLAYIKETGERVAEISWEKIPAGKIVLFCHLAFPGSDAVSVFSPLSKTSFELLMAKEHEDIFLFPTDQKLFPDPNKPKYVPKPRSRKASARSGYRNLAFIF